ncbi:DUF4328 domain-containing protein [Kitasatospora hibisci]|uniref:DUF4328 domain-containing protein n=1 Tax=Kitasatospora hibisci TaxID=3369522 RepID=UPI0037541515
MQPGTVDLATAPAAPSTPVLRDPRELAAGLQVAVGGELALQLALTATGGTRGPLAWARPLLALFVLIACTVMLCWLRRCRLNAQALAPDAHRYSPGFAVAGWFIPVAMWWIPRRVVLDVRRASGLGGRTWLVEGWWWTRLAKIPVAVALGVSGTTSGYMLAPQFVPFNVVSAILLVLTVREITAAQAQRLGPGARPSRGT